MRPRDIFMPERKGSGGLALTEASVRAPLLLRWPSVLKTPFAAGPIVNGIATAGGDAASLMLSPHDQRERVGTVRIATPAQLEEAIAAAPSAAQRWDTTPAAERARILELAADLFERDRVPLMAALVREAGKTLEAAQAEVREAVDYLRYYACEARRLFSGPVRLKGPTGEENTLSCGRAGRSRASARGIFRWRFSPGRSRRRLPPAIPSSQSRPSRPRHRLPRGQAAA